MKIPESLYSQIVRMMPIACVDLLVVNGTGKVLLVKRNNHPAKGHWWFPGGRIWFGETRVDAVKRKLEEECRLRAAEIAFLNTYDVMLDRPDTGTLSHGITSLYHVRVADHRDLRLDRQSSDAAWDTVEHWLEQPLHAFVQERLTAYRLK